MNNQVIVNNQGVQDKGDLITYFQINQTGKNYIFYSKNEIGPNDTIKLYVCEEINPQIMSNGIQNEWDNIKNIMAKIIKGENISDINYLPYKSDISVNSEKHIGLINANIDKLKSSYSSNIGITQDNVTPADILNQNFGSNNQSVPEIPVNLGVNEVKNYDMEQTSANLNAIPSVEPLPEIPKIEPIVTEPQAINVNVTPLNPEIPTKVEDNSTSESLINQNPFNVGNENNVFDIQNTNGIDTNNVINNESADILPTQKNTENVSIDSDLVDAEIAMNDKEINLYKSRIEFLESKNKFLQSKKNNLYNNNDLSNTASSLFDNNGMNEKVLTNVPDLNKVS